MSGAGARQRGFSLPEILVAVAILAGLMAALGPMLGAAARVASRLHLEAQYEEDARIARRFLQDVFSQSVWLDKDSSEAPITGDARQLQVTTLDPLTKSPMRVSLTIDRDETQRLMARFTANSKDGPPDTDERYVLLSNLSNARFAYMTRQGDGRRWRDRWDDPAPPALIRFSGALQYGSQTRDFAFEASPDGAAPLHCAFDRVSRQCR